jgi:hypothetical protein
MIVGQHLVGAGRRLEQAGDARPERADRAAGGDREHDVQERGHAVERGADVHGPHASHEVLALAADVEEAGPERERDREAERIRRVVRISVCCRLIARLASPRHGSSQ